MSSWFDAHKPAFIATTAFGPWNGSKWTDYVKWLNFSNPRQLLDVDLPVSSGPRRQKMTHCSCQHQKLTGSATAMECNILTPSNFCPFALCSENAPKQ